MRSSSNRILKRMQKRKTSFTKTAIHSLHFDIQYLFELAVLLKQAKEADDVETMGGVVDSIIELVDKYKDMMDENDKAAGEGSADSTNQLGERDDGGEGRTV